MPQAAAASAGASARSGTITSIRAPEEVVLHENPCEYALAESTDDNTVFFLSFMDNHLLSSSTSSAGLVALDVTSDPSQGCPAAGARSPERLFARSRAGVA